MSLSTNFSEHQARPPWPVARAFVRQCTLAMTNAVVTFVTRRAARLTLRELDQLDDRLLADIGLDREALAALMRGIKNRT